MSNTVVRARASLRIALLASAVAFAAPTLAQTTTASIRGTVAHGANAQIVAVDTSSGAQRRATADGNGAYTLPGLRPGTYDITFTAGAQSTKQQVTIGVGENSTLDVDVATPPPAPSTAANGSSAGQIVVTGRRLVETRTSEVGTNVTTQQIENLPQASRNFLNFAQLAPGVRLSTNATRKTFSGSGVSENPNGESLGGPQVNVFIDGVSLKSDIQQGGIVGGDSSKGNPFPQAAIQEFRVISSNYKAEYEDAGTTVISAVTKSGGNEFHGEAFGFFQLNSLRSKDYFQKQNEAQGIADDGHFEQKQYGLSLGGPIIKDKLHFFVAYEANEQKNVESVTMGQRTPENIARFGKYEGSFTSPFREDLGFAKLTLDATDDDTIDLSGSIRKEKDKQGFGGQTAVEAGSNIKNDVYTGRLRWAHNKGDFLNEASLDYLYFKFDPTAITPDTVGQQFNNAIRIGGASTNQKVVQKGFTLRDNVTLSNIDFLGGNHVVKFGGKVAFVDYTVNSAQNGNPVFNYNNDPSQNESFEQPFEALYGVGDPTVHAKDTQIGVFAQDDWKATDKLTFNIGLRWDYETNAKNNDFVTSPEAITALNYLQQQITAQGGSFKASDYISNGKNRKPFWKAFQPRLGASFDVFGDQRTVLFAGWGRYYDRTLFRNAAEEQLDHQFVQRRFEFSPDGADRNGEHTIQWDPKYLSKGALDDLIAQSIAPQGDLRIIRNDVEPPRTDQLSLGVRQKFGRLINTSIAYNHVVAKHQIAYFPANRSVNPNADGFYDTIAVPGFGTVVAMSQARASKYDGMYVSIDKTFTKSSPWSFNIAYTLSFSKERGYDFNFDHPDVAAQPYLPNSGDERHHLVVSGMAQLPLDFQISTLMVFGSGQPYQVIDTRNGTGAGVVIANTGNTKPFRQIDLRLTKDIHLFGHDKTDFQLIAEVFNVFNRANFQDYDGYSPTTNDNFGTPNSLAGPPRTFQFGARFTF